MLLMFFVKYHCYCCCRYYLLLLLVVLLVVVVLLLVVVVLLFLVYLRHKCYSLVRLAFYSVRKFRVIHLVDLERFLICETSRPSIELVSQLIYLNLIRKKELRRVLYFLRFRKVVQVVHFVTVVIVVPVVPAMVRCSSGCRTTGNLNYSTSPLVRSFLNVNLPKTMNRMLHEIFELKVVLPKISGKPSVCHGILRICVVFFFGENSVSSHPLVSPQY